VRKDRGDTSVNGIAANDGYLTHADPGDIGDGIELTRLENSRRHSEIARTSPSCWVGLRRRDLCGGERRECNCRQYAQARASRANHELTV
jgi:hypothetical protein